MVKVVQARRASWWEARTLREKRLLLAAAAILWIVLIWLLVVRPLAQARAAADARLTAASTELARARAEAEAATHVVAAAPTNNPVPLPLDAFLTQNGAEQGFAGLRVTGDGPSRATVAIAQVRPAAFFAWIGQVEARGVRVESLSARANADQTISAEAVLRARVG